MDQSTLTLTCAIEEHVETVRDETQGVGPNLTSRIFITKLAEWLLSGVTDPVEQLHEGE